MSPRLFVMAVLAAAMLECNAGQPPSRQGLSLLEFGNQRGSGFTGPTNQILLQYYLGEPFNTWSLRGDDLVSDANTAVPGDPTFDVQAPATMATPFDLTQIPFNPFLGSFLQYRSADAFWRSNVDLHFDEHLQHETLLFARDPNEVFDTMAATRPSPISSGASLSTVLRSNFTSDTWPDSATLVYPPNDNWKTTIAVPGPARIRAFYSTPDFWQSGATPKGPAAAPTGMGSVKATMVVDHGLCSQLVSYSSAFSSVPIQLISTLDEQLSEMLATNAKDKNQNATISLLTSDVVSFLRMPDERDAKPEGGFFLGFGIDVSELGSVAFVDVSGSAQYWNGYAFKLLDGRLTVDPLRDYSSTGAGVSPDIFGDLSALDPILAAAFQESLDGVLLESMSKPLRPTDTPATLPESVWHTADQLQRWPGDPGFPCTPDPVHGEKIKVVSDPTQAGATTCSPLFFQMRKTLSDSLKSGHFGNFVGVPPTAFTQMWNDTALKSSDGFFYDNFRCAPLTDGGADQCQYVLPAERFNVLPDGVELVFVDGDKEYANPSFLVWLIAGDDKTIVDGKPILQQLCDPPQQATHANGFSPDTFMLGRRAFAHAEADNKTFVPTCTQVNFNPVQFHCTVSVQ